MSLVLPTVALKVVTDITIEMLKSLRVKAILLDVDNTLALHGSQKPFEGAVEWTKMVRKHGYQIIIISNNLRRRVAPFAAQFDLPFIPSANKPFRYGINKARKMLDMKSEDILIVGDQVFTDILGANFFKMKSILLEPVDNEDSLTFRFRRWLEKRVRRKIKDIKKEDGYVC